eukprot:CAMPEP_0117650258 /NCGR_PEP_ID=MMETSP0804-20121206/1444_1 /TAXON_ID=1074897 /ORGANISM="Tetraselmis astigmatica, Strain CCMP880" /LENGTH=106 /DNA_ID=CAMNT_0005456119 /DNA_START=731 /DNA_END=1050 /DNA_ORIENTATION=-
MRVQAVKHLNLRIEVDGSKVGLLPEGILHAAEHISGFLLCGAIDVQRRIDTSVTPTATALFRAALAEQVDAADLTGLHSCWRRGPPISPKVSSGILRLHPNLRFHP